MEGHYSTTVHSSSGASTDLKQQVFPTSNHQPNSITLSPNLPQSNSGTTTNVASTLISDASVLVGSQSSDPSAKETAVTFMPTHAQNIANSAVKPTDETNVTQSKPSLVYSYSKRPVESSMTSGNTRKRRFRSSTSSSSSSSSSSFRLRRTRPRERNSHGSSRSRSRDRPYRRFKRRSHSAYRRNSPAFSRRRFPMERRRSSSRNERSYRTSAADNTRLSRALPGSTHVTSSNINQDTVHPPSFRTCRRNTPSASSSVSPPFRKGLASLTTSRYDTGPRAFSNINDPTRTGGRSNQVNSKSESAAPLTSNAGSPNAIASGHLSGNLSSRRSNVSPTRHNYGLEMDGHASRRNRGSPSRRSFAVSGLVNDGGHEDYSKYASLTAAERGSESANLTKNSPTSLSQRFTRLTDKALALLRRSRGGPVASTFGIVMPHLLLSNLPKLPLPTLMRHARELSILIERKLEPGQSKPDSKLIYHFDPNWHRITIPRGSHESTKSVFERTEITFYDDDSDELEITHRLKASLASLSEESYYELVGRHLGPDALPVFTSASGFNSNDRGMTTDAFPGRFKKDMRRSEIVHSDPFDAPRGPSYFMHDNRDEQLRINRDRRGRWGGSRGRFAGRGGGYDREKFNRRGSRIRSSRSKSNSPSWRRRRANNGGGGYGGAKPIEGRWRHDKFQELEDATGDEKGLPRRDQEDITQHIDDREHSSHSSQSRKQDGHPSTVGEQNSVGSRTETSAELRREGSRGVVSASDRDLQRSRGDRLERSRNWRGDRRRSPKQLHLKSRSPSPTRRAFDVAPPADSISSITIDQISTRPSPEVVSVT